MVDEAETVLKVEMVLMARMGEMLMVADSWELVIISEQMVEMVPREETAVRAEMVAKGEELFYLASMSQLAYKVN